jgi:hypothetical protein
MMFKKLFIGFLVAALLGIGASSPAVEILNPASDTLAQESGDGGSTEGGNPGMAPLLDSEQQVLALGGSGEEGNPGAGA